CVRGLTIMYPDQNVRDIQPYPWTIRGRGHNPTVLDVTFVNSYQGIDMGTEGHELHVIRNVYGCVLRRGVYVSKCTDIGRIENVHFNPHYWLRAKPTPGAAASPSPDDFPVLVNYLNENLEAFIFGRTDWEYCLNTFVYGFRIGYKFIEEKAPSHRGGANGNFLGIGADGGRYAVYVEDAQPMGLQITNGEFVSFAGPDPTQIVTTRSFNSVVQLNNCTFWGPAKNNARLEGNGHVSFNQCHFLQWGYEPGKDRDPQVPSILVERGDLQIEACRFAQPGTHLELGPKARSAIVTGNHFMGKFGMKNQSQATLAIANNIELEK
ncbi:MAG: hypothetical protein V2A74_01475, partial [bacterium]